MKTTILLIGLLAATIFSASAQTASTFRGLDKSPMDMAYYPDDYAHDRKFAKEKVGDDKAMVRVTYCRPYKKDREIFGTKLAPYGKVWRLGADEATEVKFYQAVMVGGKKIPAGTYSLYAIPTEKDWTMIFSSDLDQWGAYSYNESLDVARVTVPTQKMDAPIENFSIRFAKQDANTALMNMGWDTTMVSLPITIVR